MADVPLTLACGRYAITEPLLTGEVRPQGVDLRTLTMASPERHWRMLRHREFDVCELSLAGYVRAVSQAPQEWTALPVFPHRRFRHGYLFVRAGSDLGDPAGLVGGSVGLRTWATTAGVWMRGILQDEHGVGPEKVRWVTENDEHLPGGAGERFRIERIPDGATIRDQLASGELDAVIYPQRLEGPDVRTLFADPAAAEVDYARRTGLFPIMHLVALRREVLERHPWVAIELVRAFDQARDEAMARLRNPRWLPLAWSERALAEQRALLGPDPWRSGVAANRRELETALRYCEEQGLTSRPLSPADLFWPSTLEELPAYTAAR